MSGSKVEGRRLNGGGELSPRSLSLRLLHTLALTEGEERRGPTQTRTIALIDLRDLSPDPTSPSTATKAPFKAIFIIETKGALCDPNLGKDKPPSDCKLYNICECEGMRMRIGKKNDPRKMTIEDEDKKDGSEEKQEEEVCPAAAHLDKAGWRVHVELVTACRVAQLSPSE
ncbi:hypothetical protein Aduo_008204 [Ancylostoma duodenale]